MRPSGICALGLALIFGALFQTACGDSLSSLTAIQHSFRESFKMDLLPDFGRRGTTVATTVVQVDPALAKLLGDDMAYPSEIVFGEGTFIKSFGTDTQQRLQIEVVISPLAEEGERFPTLVFFAGDKQIQAQGSFWVLPSLNNTPE